MKHSVQFLQIALFLCCVYVAASITSSKSVKCTKPKGTVCVIKSLPSSGSSNDDPTIEFPDLSARTVLKVLEGQLSNLTKAIAEKLTVRILWMEGLGLKSAFVDPSFEELHLRDNQLAALQSISSSSTTNSYALKLLDVRKNLLKNASLLEPFVRLEELHLDENLFEELNMDLFAKMPHLRVLSAAGNGLIRIVPPTSMLILNELVTLSLGHNRLQSIEMDNWELPSLQTLLLSNNNLEELTGMDGFEQFYDLKKIELAANRWSCGWLQHALANVTVSNSPHDADGVALDVDTDCSSEKVHGICCSFTPMAAQSEEHLFLPEIGRVREAIEQINRRHEAFMQYQKDWLMELKNTLQKHMTDLQSFFGEQENDSGRVKLQAAQIEQLERLGERYRKVSVETTLAETVEQERKKLLHFMVDMKNRLLRQAIETDSLWVQANAEKANIEQLFGEKRPH